MIKKKTATRGSNSLKCYKNIDVRVRGLENLLIPGTAWHGIKRKLTDMALSLLRN